MSGIVDSAGTNVPAVSINNQSVLDPARPPEGVEPKWLSFLTDWALMQPDNCCICLDTGSNEGNELLYCASPTCDVCVHEECYGLEGDSVKEIPWFCDRCKSPNSLEIMDRAKTRIQNKYASLEQENRGLNMLLNEIRDALTALYDTGGLEKEIVVVTTSKLYLFVKDVPEGG
ncbi:hypothetical protein K493DRAFT_359815 [Basidiobolus meristosporus CBS 931.73]|uniref:PHD-type domain-containing protein n=1 Tax=Basidiobolus meristosporus CBS 931.73 TaxID=1314790 RepID=A0A1Y1XPR1_9FUNG|nr:hypothetical protein K493DRAFT_359815 [Basidiobolus meristosporus CBS 931.73]|eukprot:ORX87740.1 hypothetical protein K493DRAFT_359815 [Basidiobolus meristosporus CBS 931.73]